MLPKLQPRMLKQQVIICTLKNASRATGFGLRGHSIGCNTCQVNLAGFTLDLITSICIHTCFNCTKTPKTTHMRRFG